MSTSREMDKEDVVYLYNGILFSHNKHEIMPLAATRMDLTIVILSKIRKRQITYDITYMWNPTFSFQSLLGAQNNNQLQMQDQVSSYQKGVFKGVFITSSKHFIPSLPEQLLHQSSPCNPVGDIYTYTYTHTYIYIFPPKKIGFSNFHLKEDEGRESMTWGNRKINSRLSKSF